MFCYVSTKADQRLQNLFANYHNFSYRCNQHTNMMKVCKKTYLNMTECCKDAKKARKWAIHFLKDIFRDTTQRKENAFYTALPSEKNNTGREKLCSRGGGWCCDLGVRRRCTFIVIGRVGRSERFCGRCPKYKRTFFACRTSRENKSDAAALCLENIKYTIWIILA